MHHSSYEKESRNLSLQRVSVRGKHPVEKWGSEIEIKNVHLKGVMELHWATNQALVHTVDDQEKDNIKQKRRVIELEAALSPHSLFIEPL